MEGNDATVRIPCSAYVRASIEHGEGPRWLARRHTAAVLDMLAGRVVECTAAGAVVGSHAMPDDVVATVHERASGGLVVALSDSVCLLDDDWTVTARTQVFEDPRVRFNEGTVAPDGALLCGTMAYDQTSPLGRVYRIRGEEVDVVRTDTVISNGIQFDADGLGWFVDSATGAIERVRYTEQGLAAAGEPIRVPRSLGMPDGLALDDAGGIWVALFGGGAVLRYDSTGAVTHRIDLPTPNPTSCTFLGGDRSRLMITTSTYGLSGDPAAGTVYVADAPHPGLVTPPYGY